MTIRENSQNILEILQNRSCFYQRQMLGEEPVLSSLKPSSTPKTHLSEVGKYTQFSSVYCAFSASDLTSILNAFCFL